MKEYTSKSPTFSNSIMVTEVTDPAHADNINAAPKQLLENTLFLKEQLEESLSGIELGVSDDGCLTVTFDDEKQEV